MQRIYEIERKLTDLADWLSSSHLYTITEKTCSWKIESFENRQSYSLPIYVYV